MAPIEVPITQSGSAQRLIDTHLVGAECAAALQHKNNLAEAFAIDRGDVGHDIPPFGLWFSDAHA
jgi:hypothetical protein